jgi:predicted dehydrogenase
MNSDPVRVSCLGIGWWSDVLADAIGRTDQIEIVSCYTRSEEKRNAFAAKYDCAAASSYEELLDDDSVQAVINTTPNSVHLETVRQAAAAGKHVFLDKPIANTIADGLAITKACEDGNVILSVGYQRRRESHFRWIRDRIAAGDFGNLVQAEGNISRDRLGKIDLSSWRYQASGMPGGVMLQIGIHYTDVLEMLMGPVKRVSAMSARLVLPGDNADVANLVLEHENGAISNLTASYASASEYYLMNIYGKEASAYYDLFQGLRYLERGTSAPVAVACERNDTIVEELEEFAACVRGESTPEVDGWRATESLAVIRAGAKSAIEGRAIDVAEIMESPDE